MRRFPSFSHILSQIPEGFLRELQCFLLGDHIISLKLEGFLHIWDISFATPPVFHSNAQRNCAFGRNCEFMPPFSQLNVTPNDTFNFFYHPNSQVFWDFEQIGRCSHSFTRMSRRIGHSSKSCRLVQTFSQKKWKKYFTFFEKVRWLYPFSQETPSVFGAVSIFSSIRTEKLC